jgi:dephospho-CoA kinase
MLHVGLTGGVASGKSTLAAMLAARGAATLDADAVVRALYRPDGAATPLVADLFGEGVLAPDGGIDRAALLRLALVDSAARRRLEAAVHPLVRREITAWSRTLAGGRQPPAVAIVEAALLVETGAYREFDLLVVVSAPRDRRRAWALAAGWTAERFDRLAAAQLSDAEREGVADRVVHNAGDRASLAEQADELWRELRERARRDR